MTKPQKETNRAGVVQEVLNIVASGGAPEAAFGCLVRQLREFTDFDLAALEWVRGGTAVVEFLSARVATTLRVGHTYSLEGTDTERVVKSREPLVKIARWRLFFSGRESSLNGELKSTLLMPVLSHGEVVGILRLARVRRKAFRDRDIEWLKGILTELGDALLNVLAGKQGPEDYQQVQREQRERLLLINTLAHELKTPLTAILASGGLLVEELQGDANEEWKKLAENIVRAASKLEARLAELVEIAKSEKVGIPLKLELVDVRPVLENIATVFRPVAAAKNQTLDLDLAKDVPLVMADRQRLEQVVMNLLSNASKFTQPGGRIWLSLVNEGKRLVVRVRDNGPGISAEEQERLFRPYYRIEADRERFEGLGLGLALCRQIVNAHGGHIWVESRRGEGSTFSFSLPVPELARIPAQREASQTVETVLGPPGVEDGSVTKPLNISQQSLSRGDEG